MGSRALRTGARAQAAIISKVLALMEDSDALVYDVRVSLGGEPGSRDWDDASTVVNVLERAGAIADRWYSNMAQLALLDQQLMREIADAMRELSAYIDALSAPEGVPTEIVTDGHKPYRMHSRAAHTRIAELRATT